MGQALKWDETCSGCPISKKAVCSRCNAEEYAMLESMKYYRSYDAGQTIMWAGDEMNFVASIVEGVATLSQALEDGRTQMVGLMLPSDFVGRPGRVASVYDIVAVTPVTLCCFRRNPFEQMMAQTPHISERLLEMTMDDLDSAREWMLVLGRKSAREKIASLLGILAKREAGLQAGTGFADLVIALPLTREAMADYLGLTLETVSRQMSALKRDGVIVLESKRTIRIPDVSRLLNEAGDDVDGGFIS